MQQGEEVLAPVELRQREAGLDIAVRRLLADDVPQQVEVAVESPADHQQVAQLEVLTSQAEMGSMLAMRAARLGCVLAGVVSGWRLWYDPPEEPVGETSGVTRRDPHADDGEPKSLASAGSLHFKIPRGWEDAAE